MVTSKSKALSNAIADALPFIDILAWHKADLVAYIYTLQHVWVAFEDADGRLLGCIKRPKGTRQNFVNDTIFTVKPQHAYGKENKEHVDRSLGPAFRAAHKQQPFVFVKPAAKRQASQACEEAIGTPHSPRQRYTSCFGPSYQKRSAHGDTTSSLTAFYCTLARCASPTDKPPLL
jgi:hypothetical protein